MQSLAQIVYILFFSVLYGATLRSAGAWRAFPTHFFRIDNRDERRAAGRRLVVGLLILNVLPFAYFAFTLYYLGRIHRGGGGLMIFHFFVVPFLAMATLGFYRIFQGVAVWGGTRLYGKSYVKLLKEVAPHPDPVAHILPGIVYVVVPAGLLVVLLLI